MPLIPTTDPEQMEQIIVSKIRDTFNAVPIIASYCKVHQEEQFPESDEEDINTSTVPDFDQPDIPYTSIIQIGIPTVAERVYTSERQTQFELVYPIMFDAGVKGRWTSPDSPYPSSRAFAMGVYMKARAKFKEDVTLGFDNCEHKYLQQESAATVTDEETGGRLHTADWSLTVHVKGVDT